MTQHTYDRLTRYAVFSALHGALSLAAVLGAFGAGYQAMLLAISIPLFWSWGAFQGDVAMNPHLDQDERNRWRIALWIVPWSMTLYWYCYVRPHPDHRA